MDPVADIKARLPIEQLVASYVQLKKVGRQFRALCPFHNERTPSFYVSPEKGLAYCFGCHKGGDHFKFIEDMEGIDFKGALVLLAEKAGIALPTHMPLQRESKSQRDRLLQVHEIAAHFFATQLWETADGAKVLDYLRLRGLKDETIRKHQLGFAPDSGTALYTFLLKHDFSKDEIVSSGCAFARDTEQSSLVDRFRMRLIFPLHNLTGAVCAFGGRALRDGDEPKYLNSPGTPIYHKSSLLYNLSLARTDIRRLDKAIIVEGYMDCLAAHQAGFTNAVACGGTALTEDQIKTLARFTKNLIFSFDRDAAGLIATDRAIEYGLMLELSISVAVWKGDAKDPDECIRTDRTLYETALNEAQSVFTYVLEHVRTQQDITSIDGKKKTLAYLMPFLSKITSPMEKDEWMKHVARVCDISATALYDEVRRYEGRQKNILSSSFAPAPSTTRPLKREEYLLGLLLTYPELRRIAFQYIDESYFEENELRNIYRSLTTEYNQPLGEDLAVRAKLLEMYVETKLSDVQWEVIEQEARNLIRMIMREKLAKEKHRLLQSLRERTGSERLSILESYATLLQKEEHL